MSDQRRRQLAFAAVLGAAALALHHPSADIRIDTHEASDPSPRSFQAAVDLGLVAVSVLVTWTAEKLAR